MTQVAIKRQFATKKSFVLYFRYLFACDETGLPAACRLLESMPASTRGKAFFEVADAAEIQDLRCHLSVDVVWLLRNGLEPGKNTLLQHALRGVRFPSDETVYAWAAAEAEIAAAIRSAWSTIKRPEFRHTATGYWKLGKSEDDYRAGAEG